MKPINFQSQAKVIIKRITRATAKTNDDIQSALEYATMHTLEHGDPYLYKQIIEAAKGTDRKAIAAWVVKHGLGTAKGTDFVVNASKRKACQGMTLEDLQGSVPVWYAEAQTTDKAIKDFDLDSRLMAFIAQVEKAKAAGTLKNAGKLAALEALALAS